jgi:hypothetical protein
VSLLVDDVTLCVDEQIADLGLRRDDLLAELDLGRPVGSPGAFGEVRELRQIGEVIPTRPLVVKVFNTAVIDRAAADDLTRRCSELVTRLRASVGSDWFRNWRAVPVAVGIGHMRGEERTWSIMRDVRADGFEAGDEVNTLHLPLDHRLDLARSFADRMAELERIEVTHTDVCLENVVVDVGTRRVQLIDLDGVVPAGLGVGPLTPGHRDEFMPPEVKGGGSAEPDLDAVNPPAERWSTAMMIGHLVLGRAPFFFLRAISEQVVQTYAAHPGVWPRIDVSSPLFFQRNRRAYEQWLTRDVPVLPDDFVATMDEFRRAGTDGGSRPTARQWARACAAVLTPPEVVEFTIDSSGGPVGMPVQLSWVVDRAERVEVVGVGTFLPSETVTVLLAPGPQRFEIVATSRIGEARARSDVIFGVNVPELTAVPWPDFPGLTLSGSLPIVSMPAFDRLVASLGNDLVVPVPSFAATPVPQLPRPPRIGAMLGVAGQVERPSVALRPPPLFTVDTQDLQGFDDRPRPWYRRWRRWSDERSPE